jgi:SAM-dependent methyltransferase
VDQKEFMRDVYANYWLDARDKKYGFMQYDQALCELIAGSVDVPGPLLEVAIGTGYPVADYLQKAGFDVHGIDISPALIERCKQLNPQIDAKVGDAENLAFANETFGCTYSFHSSWYFPDLTRVIDEMLRVTRPGGLVLFDIQNRDNPVISADFDRRKAQVRRGLLPRAQLHARNVAKILLRRGNPNWHAVIYEVPTHPALVYGHLGDRRVTVYGRNEEDQALIALEGLQAFAEYQRLLFAVRK